MTRLIQHIYVDSNTSLKALPHTDKNSPTVWGLYQHGTLVRHLSTLESALISAAYRAGTINTTTVDEK